MNKLTTARRSQVVAALVEGNSLRATCRMTGVDKGAVLKLLVDLRASCERYQNETQTTHYRPFQKLRRHLSHC